jgi:hypothetical protein
MTKTRRAKMSYCDGTCKYLNERKHKCELTGEKLTYIKYSSAVIKCLVHEHRGFCEKDKEDTKC